MFTTDYSNTGSGNSQTAAPGRIALDFSSLDNIKRAKRAENMPETPVKDELKPLPRLNTPEQKNAPQRRTERERGTEKGKHEPGELVLVHSSPSPERGEAAPAFCQVSPEPPKVDPEKEYLKARLQCSQLKAEILKQLRAGEDIHSLFLQAMKAISLLTGEKITYTVAEKELKAVYGYGLEQPPVLQTLLDETETRLNKLRAAAQEEINKDTDDYKRITGAIAAHERRAAYLRGKLECCKKQ